MRKLIIILLFISSIASGQLLTRDVTEVWSGGRNAIAENSGFGDYYYFFQNTRTVNRLNGSITKVVIHATAVPTDSLIFEVWRYDGSAYDRIYREDIKAKVTEGVIDTISLAASVSALEGDYVALKSVNGGSFGYIDYGLASSTLYGSADIYMDGVDDIISDSLTSALTQALTIKLIGQAPLAVIIGNSIATGHPGHYSGVESSLTNDPPYSIGNQLYQLDTDWVIQNMGTGSTTSSYLNDNFVEYVLDLSPKYAIVESGVNDIATSVAKSTYIVNMTEFLDSCDANSIAPIILKILPWTDGTNTQMQTRDDWMTDLEALVATYTGAYFIDLDTALGEFRTGGDAGNLWDMQAAYAADGVHPNEAGYTKIASVINTVVNTSTESGDIGGDYYVATDGDDDAAGTYAAPWATFQKAFDVADAGDTVYFRGGVYYSTARNVIDPENINGGGVHGNNGTSASPICFFGYPGETPILDCINHCDPYTGYNQGILLVQVEHLKFKNITVRNVFLCADNQVSGAIASDRTANIHFEDVTIYQVEGRGFHWLDPGAWNEGLDLDGLGNPAGPAPFSSDSTYWINCDVYAICDTSVTNPGNAGDGWKCHTYYGNYYYWEGCRAWQYSDDGFDMSGQGERIFKNCWAMPTNTYEEFDIEANGFKAGAVNPVTIPSGGHRDTFLHYENCLAVFGNGTNSTGFFDLDYEGYQMTNGEYYNNTSWGMVYGFLSNTHYDSLETAIWRNNISYNNTILAHINGTGGLYTESNNTWDAALGSAPWSVPASDLTVTDDDFVTVDSATIAAAFVAARGSNNELPTFPIRLVEGSDLIDAGVDVGLTYSGSAPDIGAFEWSPVVPRSKHHTYGGRPLMRNGRIQVLSLE